MTDYQAIFEHDEIMYDVRQRKANIIEKHGGWEGYLKYQDNERIRLESEGRHFVTPEEVMSGK